jgi:ABC-type branched-subunit amino acid transport system ATPase component
MSESHALEARKLTVSYGGLRALDGVDITVPAGAIVGLIGPNGAGKTTFFDCVSGLVRPTSGRVHLFGRDVTDLGIHERVHLGLARTFQRLELFGSLTVRENLIVAAESASDEGGLVSDLLRLPWSTEGRKGAGTRADSLLRALGLEEHAATRAADLPMGLARLTELGRALCSNPRLLLLDEPSSGLTAPESDRLAKLLRQLRDRTRRTVLVVEHDMRFVLELCDHVFVLDFGKLIASGTPAQIRTDPAVQAAYLGEMVDGAPARN